MNGKGVTGKGVTGAAGRIGRAAPQARPGAGPVRIVAPAKLTLSLRVRGRRPDGYHDLESEMVSVDLCDVLTLDPQGHGLEVVAEPGTRADGLDAGGANLVVRALAAAGQSAAVRLLKRIPVGGGLGGGSADAAAVLRWAGVSDPALAAQLGADVPFCVRGGRAMVSGLGDRVDPLPFVPRAFVLLVPPFSVDTAAVYRSWDHLHRPREDRCGDPGAPDAGEGLSASRTRNDLTDAAVATEPRLARWATRLGEASGQEPVLAGSGSTWFVEGTLETLGMEGLAVLRLGRDEGRLIAVCTVPAGWTGPGATWDGATADR